jgi:RHS repeat-associated core domain
MEDELEQLATDYLSSVVGFNGERIDPVLGGYHLGNGYRLYSPSLRRFTSPDSMSPFGQGGINPYAYCEGDPINNTDPTGHMPLRRVEHFMERTALDMATDGDAELFNTMRGARRDISIAQMESERVGHDVTTGLRRMDSMHGRPNITEEPSRYSRSQKVIDANKEWKRLPSGPTRESSIVINTEHREELVPLGKSDKKHSTYQENYLKEHRLLSRHVRQLLNDYGTRGILKKYDTTVDSTGRLIRDEKGRTLIKPLEPLEPSGFSRPTLIQLPIE